MSSQSFLPVSLHRVEAEVLASTAREQCEEHGESLSMFCLDDLEPLCELCAVVCHAGHRVYLLTEAAVDCKEELRTSLKGLMKKMTLYEKVTQTCEDAHKHNQAEATFTEEHMKKEFESLHQFLREEEAARLLALREEQEEKKRDAEEQIERMNQLIKSLEERMKLVEGELDAGGDGVGYLENHQDRVDSAWTGHREPQEGRRPLIDVAKHLGNLQYAEWEKMRHIAPYTPVTLDPRTAGRSLRVSPGLNSVQVSPGTSQGLLEQSHPYSCILAREGFDSGVHCWDIEIADTNNWTVGVAIQSVFKSSVFEACPEAGLWCLSLREGEYLALTSPAQALNSQHFRRVRVRLDWDEGTLEFTNADTDRHLFKFRHRFTDKLYPYFESISLCGGFTVLAQRVKVSVGSDVEDTAITQAKQAMASDSCTEGDIDAAFNKSNRKMSERGRPTEDKNLPISSTREEKKTKPQRCTSNNRLIETKPAGKEKTTDNKPAVKPQSSKPRFSVTYHVSLNRAHQQ